jgi:hypothetical protein
LIYPGGSALFAIRPTASVNDGEDSASCRTLSGFDSVSNRTFSIPNILPGEYRSTFAIPTFQKTHIKEARYGGIDH